MRISSVKPSVFFSGYPVELPVLIISIATNIHKMLIAIKCVNQKLGFRIKLKSFCT